MVLNILYIISINKQVFILLFVLQIGGVQINTVKNKSDGTFCLKEMMTKYRDGSNLHNPTTSLICVENTHNYCGGKALPMSWVKEVRLGQLSALTYTDIIR